MKNYLFIFLAFLVSISIGILARYYKNDILSLTNISSSTNSSRSIIPTKKYQLNYLIEEDQILASEQSDNLGISVEKLLSGNNYDFNFVLLEKKLSKKIRKKRKKELDFESAKSDPLNLSGKDLSNGKIQILFKTSDDPDFSCAGEIQILTWVSSEINNFKDLSGKRVGIATNAVSIFKKMFLNQNPSMDKLSELYTFDYPGTVIEKFKDHQIDALVVKVKKYENDKIFSKMIKDGNKFIETPEEIKSIYTSDLKIPCEVIYIANSVPENIVNEFKQKIQDTYLETTNKKTLMKTLGIANVAPLAEYERHDIIDIILNDKTIPLKDLSRLIIR